MKRLLALVRERPALALLLLAGVGMRVLAAWCYAATMKADHGIVCLMVKHMLAGGPIPIFYYGQAYLGAFEPWVSALLCSVFGQNGFAINMGTALVALACLPLVYAWGTGAAGRIGGLAALAFCVIGPPVYFQYEGWAYGGYAAIPLLNCAVILATARLLVREGRGETRLHGRYFLLGLVAGLGWWQSPLLLPAFLTSALAFLAVLRARVFSLRLAAGAAGFFLASAPMWIWNWRHGWQTMEMLSTAKKPSFLEGLRLFFLVRMPDLLQFPRPFSRTALLFAALLLLLLALALYRFVRRVRERDREQAIHLGIALFYTLMMAFLFTMSHYAKVNALRYELVMVPVLGVLVGAATAWLVERARWGAGWLPLAAFVFLQASAMPSHFREREQALSFAARARDMGDFLRARGIREVYADYQLYRASHGLNFLLDEEFVFSAHAAEKVKPYKVALELAERPAVLNDMMQFDDFLGATLGTAETASFTRGASPYNRLELRHAIRPPALPVRPVLPPALDGIYETGSSNRLDMLADDAFDTQRVGGRSGADWELRLKEPRTLAGARLVCPERGWPGSLRVEGWDEGTGSWRELRPVARCTRFFWSGPRFYWGGAYNRLECRFDPVSTRRLRLRLTNGLKYNRCDIAEVQLLEPDPRPAVRAEEEGSRLASLLEERKIVRLYADRWEANQLYRRTQGRIRLPLDANSGCLDGLPPEMAVDAGTALLVRNEEAELTRRVLAARSIAARETACGGWLLFDFPGISDAPAHYRHPGLRWAGFGCLLERDGEWAQAASASARRLARAGDLEGARKLADKAAALSPADPRLASLAAGLCEALGDHAAAARYGKRKEGLWPPASPVWRRLSNGVELCGVSVMKGGDPQTLVIRYNWRVPPGDQRRLVPVYVHLKAGGRRVAQDDHVVDFPACDPADSLSGGWELLGPDGTAVFPFLTEERRLMLPGPPAGNLELVVGPADTPALGWRDRLAQLLEKGERKLVVQVALRE